MAPAKRKAGAATQTASKKTQKTQKKGKAKPKRHQVQVPVDEAFDGCADAVVFISDDGTIHDASLNQTNIGDNNNKVPYTLLFLTEPLLTRQFYFLQLLKCEKCKQGSNFWTHTRWGRVGEFGQSKTIGPSDEEEALTEFEKKFGSKTGLSWDERTEEPLGGKKYTYLEKAYEDEDDSQKTTAKGKDAPKSKLPIQTQRLIELIFNENHFNSVLEDIGYNKDKLPLGKLGKNTLKTGFKHLQELASLIKHPSLAQNKYSMTQKAVCRECPSHVFLLTPSRQSKTSPTATIPQFLTPSAATNLPKSTTTTSSAKKSQCSTPSPTWKSPPPS
jgi:poly [ADP-ribose] polymerase 2/3/4